MRYLLALLFFVSSSFGAMAQNNCYYKTNKVDKFTKKVVKESNLKTLFLDGLTGSVSIAGKSDGDSKYLILSIKKSSVFGLSEASELMLLLGNAEVVTLQSMESVVASPPISSGITAMWHARIYYGITSEQIGLLTNNPVTDVRIYTTDGYIERTFKKKKQQERIGAVMRCFQ